MGTVYLAYDASAERFVALKLIRLDRLSPDVAAKLKEEFQAITSLHHPQIATAYDFGYTDEASLPFYTREYIQGSPLPPGPPGGGVPPREFLRPILDLLDALDYLHAHGILHLDIHPGNLIVADDPERGSVLIDFGLIRPHGPYLSTSVEFLSGMPPEVLRKGEAIPETDLFLAGRLLLYRLRGEARGDARLPREIPGWGPRLTLELERIAEKALQADPLHRFRSAGEMRDALFGVVGRAEKKRKSPEPGEITTGRETELQKVDHLLQRATSGESAILWFTGPSGLGKTRLLAETRLRAQLMGLPIAEVRFSELGPGSGLLRALESISAGRREKLRWIEPLAAEHGGTPDERARRAAEAYFEEEEKPLIFLLDDFDLADRESRFLAEALLLEGQERRSCDRRGLGLVISSTQPPREGVHKTVVHLLKPLRAKDARNLLRILLRPLSVPENLIRKAAAQAGGSPLRIRRIARSIHDTWGKRGVVPRTAELPAFPADSSGSRWSGLEVVRDRDREILAALAVLRRPARDEEIAAALGISLPELRRRLASLKGAEMVTARRLGRMRVFQLTRPGDGDEILPRHPPGLVRRIHQRLAAFLKNNRRLDLAARENLVRHLFGSGKKTEALKLALSVASTLRGRGLFNRAVRLLEDGFTQKFSPRVRFRLAELMSSILEENGDHRKGVALLAPIYRKDLPRLRPAETIRLRRRLGVHFHRSGQAEKAMEIFEETQRIADPRRDLEDLIFIDSEIAELCNLRGHYDRAEEACRRGFERLRSLRWDNDFRARMELTLRASLGHLELRRLRLPLARAELRSALKLSRRVGRSALEAVILNNLGMVENYLNHFREAERCLRGAERLLLAAGERRPVISIACNLAVIAAKRGRREEANGQVERALQLLRHYPGKRLEFFAEYTRGTVAELLGEAGSVLDALPRALPIGRQVGDHYLCRFGEVYLAEAYLATGRYRQALKELEATRKEAEESGPPILRRMVHARLLLLASLLSHSRLAKRSEKALEDSPPTDVPLLEAWNGIYIGFARLLSGEPSLGIFKSSLETFGRWKVVFGEQFARLGLLAESLLKPEEFSLEIHLLKMEPESSIHRFLAVALPLARAEGYFQLGDIARARDSLSEASGAIVGSPFLELDWQIELLRARIAWKSGDISAAREHNHRSLHTRDLLLQLLPAGFRQRFLSHPRFRKLHELSARLEKSPRHISSMRLRISGTYEGMVGQSMAMQNIFQAIDRLSDQEIPILISGDTGTGKELVARAIHRTSLRHKGPFFAIHCSSLPVELFESEFFGYEAGAFTGAEESRPGLLESLSGGTILLDGVSELPREAQAKLLRILDSRVVRRLGSAREHPVDVRFLASTTADLKALVKAGVFREDLLYRLGMEIHLPPLSERKEDIAPLARHLLEKHGRRLDRPVPAMRSDALELLESEHWPGNVRELEVILLRALVSLSFPEVLDARDLEPFLPDHGKSLSISRSTTPAKEPIPAKKRLFDEGLFKDHGLEELKVELERAYLVRTFREVRGDLRKMMKILGVKKSYLYSWIKRVGLDIRALRCGRS